MFSPTCLSAEGSHIYHYNAELPIDNTLSLSEQSFAVYRSSALKITMLEVSMKLPSVGNYRIFKTLCLKCSSKGTLDLQEQSHR